MQILSMSIALLSQLSVVYLTSLLQNNKAFCVSLAGCNVRTRRYARSVPHREMQGVVSWWDKAIESHCKLAGVVLNRPERVVLDVQISAGWVSLTPFSIVLGVAAML
jgi:hypothetical protein